MSQPATQFSLPPISSPSVLLLIMSSLSIMLLPMPPYFLDMVIAINLIIPLLIVFIAVYSHRLSNLASLPPVLGLSVFFRLAISIAMFRYFCIYKLWDEHIWKSAHDVMTYFQPASITDFVTMIGSGNLLYSSLLCFIFCSTAVLALLSAFIASSWTKPQTEFELQTINTRRESLLISSEMASFEQESIIQAGHTFLSLRGAALLLSLEAMLGIVIALLIASMTLVQGNHPVQTSLRLWDLPITAHSLTLHTKLLTLSIILGGEALIRGIPLLLTSLSLWLLLSRRDPKAQSLGEQVMENLTSHPYSLLFAGLFLTYLTLFSVLFAGHSYWYLYFSISLLLIGIAFSVFLTADVQEQLKQLEQALDQRKILLGVSRDSQQPVSPIRFEVSEAFSLHFQLHHINTVKLEDFKLYPCNPVQPSTNYQEMLKNLPGIYLSRMKLMKTIVKRLVIEPGTGSELLNQLQTLYDKLEQELGHPILPIQIQINNTLVNGQYRLLSNKKVQAIGEIGLSEDKALNVQALQDLVEQIKLALLSNTTQQ